MEPKHPDSIFKTHLEERKLESQLDSAKENLAKTYVNAFVNAGLCNDLLISAKGEGADDWVFSNKDEGQLAAAASLGLLQIWDIDEGLESIDKYLERSEDNI